MTIKGIIFDLDGTLIDFTDNIKWWLDTKAKLLKSFGLDKIPTHEEAFHILFDENGNDTLLSWGVNPDVYWQKLVDKDLEVRKKMINNGLMKPYEDVRCIRSLKKKYRVALVTDTPNKITSFILERFNLRNLFENIITSEYRGKPNPRGLVECIRILGLKPEECVYIGDSTQDVEVGKRAGVQTIFVRRKHNKDSIWLNDDANIFVDSLSEIEEKVKNLGGK